MATNIDKALFQQPQGLESLAQDEEPIEIEIIDPEAVNIHAGDLDIHIGQDEEGNKFIAEQFTKDFVVKVDAHSNSPIFTEDMRQLAFNLFKAQAIDKESLLDLLEPPMKQLLIDKLKKLEKQQSQQPPQQGKPEGKPDLKAVGE